MMKAYFVTYTQTIGIDTIGPTNIVLRGVHPAIWASTPPVTAKRAGHVTRILFYAECDPALADDVNIRQWCGSETR